MANLRTRPASRDASGSDPHAAHRADQGRDHRAGVALGVDYGLTLSCYDPTSLGEACGRCDSCATPTRRASKRTACVTRPATRPRSAVYGLRGSRRSSTRSRGRARTAAPPCSAGSLAATSGPGVRATARDWCCSVVRHRLRRHRRLPGGGRSRRRRDWPMPCSARGRPERSATRFVVCTGGEPLLQLDAALVDALHARGVRVAVETNGTLAAPPRIDWICVSPKAGAEFVRRTGDELKLVFPQEGLDPSQFEHLRLSSTSSSAHGRTRPRTNTGRLSSTALPIRSGDCSSRPTSTSGFPDADLQGVQFEAAHACPMSPPGTSAPACTAIPFASRSTSRAPSTPSWLGDGLRRHQGGVRAPPRPTRPPLPERDRGLRTRPARTSPDGSGPACSHRCRA